MHTQAKAQVTCKGKGLAHSHTGADTSGGDGGGRKRGQEETGHAHKQATQGLHETGSNEASWNTLPLCDQDIDTASAVTTPEVE